MSHTARRRLTGSLLAGILVAGALVYLASLGVPGNPMASTARADDPEPVEITAAEAAADLLARLGISPESLAAVGASPAQASAIVLVTHVHLVGNADAIAESDEVLADARIEQARLLALVQSGQATIQQVSELGAANALVVAATTDVSAALAGARTQILGGLTEGQRISLELIRTNQAQYGSAMPVAVAADIWTDAEWIESRAALCNVAQAESYGVQPGSGAADLADETMDRAAVAAAHANITEDLAAVTAAWESALGGL